ncbi:MAG: right-handed parallel beta-helix repeat-containing protein [Muribaculaceae bacterium]|nr:right-handed parallel beta-helix repeat-containing protein [Muribaculaceae bacterium]
MKRLFTLCLVACAMIAQAKVYTLADLASYVGTIENVYQNSAGEDVTETIGVAVENGEYVIYLPTKLADGVTGIGYDDNNIVISTKYLTIKTGNSLKVNEGEVLRFSGAAELEIEGSLEATGATFGAAVGFEEKAKGFRIYKEGSAVTLNDCLFEYVGINYGNGSDTGSFYAENCTFYKHNTKGGNAAINFTSLSKGNVIKDCVFEDNALSSIASGANVSIEVTISGCVFNKSITSTRVYPSINVSTSADNIIIENNEVHGPAVNTRAGGIAVSNLLGGDNAGTVYVRKNLVENCSYGITLTGPGNIVMEENIVRNNKYIANPNQGGSGLNITCNTTAEGKIAKAFIRGNHIEGNIWGVTIIGTNVDINAGKVEDPNAEDYNPGQNVFVDNTGTTDYPHCDWFNNTITPSYAQGNIWSVEVQDEEHISQNIYMIDGSAVYYMPAGEMATAGDVNGDGSLDVLDVTAVINIILGNLTEYNSEMADVNGDGQVNVLDVTAMINMILGN